MGNEPNKEKLYKEPGKLSNDELARYLPETPNPIKRRIR